MQDGGGPGSSGEEDALRECNYPVNAMPGTGIAATITRFSGYNRERGKQKRVVSRRISIRPVLGLTREETQLVLEAAIR